MAAALTGTSQLVALLGAPLVGWSCDRFDRKYILLLTAVVGIFGFGGFGMVSDYPRGAPAFIFAMLSGDTHYPLSNSRIESDWRYSHESRIIDRSIRRRKYSRISSWSIFPDRYSYVVYFIS